MKTFFCFLAPGLLWLLLCHDSIYAQNLVPNSDFEIGSCPTNQAWVDLGGVNVPPWGSANIATPDYFSICGIPGIQPLNNGWGVRIPNSGDDFTGVLVRNATPNRREYLQVRLTAPLVAGENYDVGFYVIASDARYVTDDIGMYISTTAPTRADVLVINATPQVKPAAVISDQVNWTLISAVYTATGGEEYITIGSFANDATQTLVDLGVGFIGVYYFVDDPYVTRVSPLPIEIGDLKISEGPNSSVKLNWNTFSEKNNDYFEIERSRDGINYETLSRVQGNGNSSELIEYSSYDEHPLNGLVYYRLKQVDFNGSEKHYDPVSYNKITYTIKPNVYPNPFNEELVISSIEENGEVKVVLINMLGEVVYETIQKASPELKIRMKDFIPDGNYILKITTENGQSVEKIVKG